MQREKWGKIGQSEDNAELSYGGTREKKGTESPQRLLHVHFLSFVCGAAFFSCALLETRLSPGGRETGTWKRSITASKEKCSPIGICPLGQSITPKQLSIGKESLLLHPLQAEELGANLASSRGISVTLYLY